MSEKTKAEPKELLSMVEYMSDADVVKKYTATLVSISFVLGSLYGIALWNYLSKKSSLKDDTVTDEKLGA